MFGENMQGRRNELEEEQRPIQVRARDLWHRAWQPAGTVVAVALAGMLMWHVVNGKHGLTVWNQKRAEDQQLRREIQDLQSENTQLKKNVYRLQNDPGAIVHEAHEKLHYAKPNEVIITLPSQPKTQTQPAGAGR